MLHSDNAGGHLAASQVQVVAKWLHEDTQCAAALEQRPSRALASPKQSSSLSKGAHLAPLRDCGERVSAASECLRRVQVELLQWAKVSRRKWKGSSHLALGTWRLPLGLEQALG